jgi:hypothetical protein
LVRWRQYQEFALSDETFDLYFVQTRPLQGKREIDRLLLNAEMRRAFAAAPTL